MSDQPDAHKRALESLKLRVYRDGQRLRDAIENCGAMLPDTLRDPLLASVMAGAVASRPRPLHSMRG